MALSKQECEFTETICREKGGSSPQREEHPVASQANVRQMFWG